MNCEQYQPPKLCAGFRRRSTAGQGRGTPSGEKNHARRVACGRRPIAKTTSPTLNTRQEVSTRNARAFTGRARPGGQWVRRPKFVGGYALIHMLRVIYQLLGPQVRALLPETFSLIFSSKVLKNDVRGVVRMKKKPLGTARYIKKVMVLYFFIFFSPASSFPIF